MARSYQFAKIGAKRNPAFDMKDLGMRLAGGLGEDVIGQAQAARLQPFLQEGLGILALMRRVDRVDPGPEQALDDTAGSVEAGIEQRRAKQRFKRIGENRRTLGAAAFQFAFTQAQMLAQCEFECNFME